MTDLVIKLYRALKKKPWRLYALLIPTMCLFVLLGSILQYLCIALFVM